MLNKVIAVANLAKDPDLKYTASGTAVCNLRLAINRQYDGKGGEKKQEACFITAVVWGKRAENCIEYLHKGDPLFLEGRLQSRSWEDGQGQKRSAIEIVIENIQFINRAKEGTSPAEQSEEPGQSGEES